MKFNKKARKAWLRLFISFCNSLLKGLDKSDKTRSEIEKIITELRTYYNVIKDIDANDLDKDEYLSDWKKVRKYWTSPTGDWETFLTKDWKKNLLNWVKQNALWKEKIKGLDKPKDPNAITSEEELDVHIAVISYVIANKESNRKELIDLCNKTDYTKYNDLNKIYEKKDSPNTSTTNTPSNNTPSNSGKTSSGEIEDVKTEVIGKDTFVEMSHALQSAFKPNEWVITNKDILIKEITEHLLPNLKSGKLEKIEIQATCHTNRNTGQADNKTWDWLVNERVKTVKQFILEQVPVLSKNRYKKEDLEKLIERISMQPIDISGKKWTPNVDASGKPDGTLGPRSAFLNVYAYKDKRAFVKGNPRPTPFQPDGNESFAEYYQKNILNKPLPSGQPGALGPQFYILFTQKGNNPELWQSGATENALYKINLQYYDKPILKPGAYANLKNVIDKSKKVIWTDLDHIAGKDVIQAIGELYDPFITLYIFYKVSKNPVGPTPPPKPDVKKNKLFRKNKFKLNQKSEECHDNECEITF